MHFDFGDVALDIPRVLRDETTYVFENREIGETLFVMSEPPEPRLTPGAVIDELVRPLKSGMAPVFQVSAEDLIFLGHPATKAEYQIGPGGRLRMFILVAIGPHETHVVRWIFGQLQDDESERFARLIDGVRLADEPWTRDAAPDHVRRQAGLLTLEVPTTLASPTSFLFATENGEIRLAIDYREQEAAPGPPELEEVVPPEEEERLTVEQAEENPLTRPVLAGWSGRYEVSLISSTGQRQRLVRQLKLRVEDDLSFVIVGVGVRAGMRQLDIIWSQLEATLTKGK